MSKVISISNETISKIDDHLNKLSYGYLKTSSEIREFKEEIKSNLIISIKELISEGYKEEDALRMSLDRLGDIKNIRYGLNSVYNIRFLSKKWLFRVAILLGVLGLLIKVGLFNWEQYIRRLEVTNVFKIVYSNLGEQDNPVTEEMEKKLKVTFDSAIFPNAIGIQKIEENDTSTNSFMYVYPGSTLTNSNQIQLREDLLFKDVTWNEHLKIPNSNTSIFVSIRTNWIQNYIYTIGTVFLILYWITFLLGASSDIMYNEKNKIWILTVLLLNIIGYALYKLVEYKLKQRDTILKGNY